MNLSKIFPYWGKTQAQWRQRRRLRDFPHALVLAIQTAIAISLVHIIGLM
jgi:hypothetical protein